MTKVRIRTKVGTYTVVDVRRVFESFQADLSMLTARTGLWENDYTEKITSDVLLFASKDYLEHVSIVLCNESNNRIRMKKYRVETTEASSWGTDRPGGNNWPATPKGCLSVVLHYSSKFLSRSDSEKENFKKQCHFWWSPSSLDTSTSGMVLNKTKRYSSNGYGLLCQDYRL